ncbi:hypothetical protein [Streptomyces liangshanensis]|uniref:hypothetical protein n=1 Tax=Streptomyces liangshanensis TaxID=2717324 RepID=UPI001FBB8040|nr:hypothetical protein [Streptomyces liangshanensis]
MRGPGLAGLPRTGPGLPGPGTGRQRRPYPRQHRRHRRKPENAPALRGTLPLLRKLSEEKRIPAVDHPLSDKPGKPALHRVADSNLRPYLAALRAAHEQARRGRAVEP